MKENIKIHTFCFDGAETDYFSFGSGSKNMVILPGLSLKSVMSSAESVAKAYDEFADEYTVYVIDRRKNPFDGYEIRDAARDTAELLTQLSINDVYLFGASYGGMLSQQIAVDYPQLVKKLIVSSSMSRASEKSSQILTEWLSLAKAHEVVLLNRSFVNNVYSPAFLEKFGSVFKMFEKDGSEEECELLCVYASAAARFDIYASLDKIKCPMLVIGAYGDRVLYPEAALETAEKAGCECYMYGEDYSHAVYDEAPDFKQRIKNFFND